jgi:hypothetical protein
LDIVRISYLREIKKEINVIIEKKGKSHQRQTRQGEGGTKEFTAREVEGKFVAEA